MNQVMLNGPIVFELSNPKELRRYIPFLFPDGVPCPLCAKINIFTIIPLEPECKNCGCHFNLNLIAKKQEAGDIDGVFINAVCDAFPNEVLPLTLNLSTTIEPI